jgi:hypothetical protein
MDKLCNTCGVTKLLTEFYSDKTHKGGTHSMCKLCNNAQSKLYRERNAEKVTAYKHELKRKDPIKYMLIQVKARCKHLGGSIPFDLAPADVEYVTHCPVLGTELDYLSRQSHRGMVADHAASLDRIIPERGYVRGNVKVISWRANRLKGDATVEEMHAMSKYYTSIVESVDRSLL